MGCFTFLLGLFAAAVFVASFVVHALALIPGTVLPMERIVWLHGLTMLAFFLMLIHSSIVHNRAVRLGCRDTEVQTHMMSQLPCAVSAIGIALFLYAILNFVHFAVTVEGSARFRDGKYVLMKKAVLLREISEAEFHEHRRLDLQGMSGHWLIFSWVAASYFLFVAPRMRNELDDMPLP